MMANENPIPKILHYCWFGGAPLTEKAEAGIERWHELMPEYKILRWDETSFDVNECAWTRDAYRAKKWAFVSDYVRFKVVYDNGGTYMDIGSRLLKSIDPLVEQSGFAARDWESRAVAPGLALSAKANCSLLGETLDVYRSLRFEDSFEYLCDHTVNRIFGEVLSRHGCPWESDEVWEWAGFRVYPSEYFCPKLDRGGYRCTDNTYATHLSTASWMSEDERFRVAFINKWAPRIGDFAARKTARILTILKYRKDGR